jgi:hypothetical protein
MPGWDLAASVYATGVQPDFDADWADDAGATVGAGKRSLAFEKQVTSPHALAGAPPAETPPGGPTFVGGDPVASPVAPPKGDPTQGLPPGVRVPLWTPADSAPPFTRPDAVIPWRKMFTFVVLVVLVVGGYRAYPRVHAWYVARSVPADLRAYTQGKGVRYRPKGQGFEVLLPKAPAHGDVPLGIQPAPWTAIHRAVVTGADYHIVIRVGELASDATLPFGLAGALADARFGGRRAPHALELASFDDEPAYEFHVDGPRPITGRVFRRGTRVYVVSVQSKSAGHVLDTVLHSLTLDGG